MNNNIYWARSWVYDLIVINKYWITGVFFFFFWKSNQHFDITAHLLSLVYSSCKLMILLKRKKTTATLLPIKLHWILVKEKKIWPNMNFSVFPSVMIEWLTAEEDQLVPHFLSYQELISLSSYENQSMFFAAALPLCCRFTYEVFFCTAGDQGQGFQTIK